MDTIINLLAGFGLGCGAVFAARWAIQFQSKEGARLRVNLGADASPDHMQSKTFTVRDALNGKYIQFHKHKYNPNGPDINEQCVYIVKDDETLLDAISVVLVLMDKE